MSRTPEWELTVPEDGEQLMASLRHRGVLPGQRITVRIVESEQFEDDEPQVPKIFGSFDGPPDLASRASEILEAEFPGDW